MYLTDNSFTSAFDYDKSQLLREIIDDYDDSSELIGLWDPHTGLVDHSNKGDILNWIQASKEMDAPLLKLNFHAPRGYSLKTLFGGPEELIPIHYQAVLAGLSIFIKMIKERYPLLDESSLKMVSMRLEMHQKIPLLSISSALSLEAKEFSGETIQIPSDIIYDDTLGESITAFNTYMYKELQKQGHAVRRIGKYMRFDLDEFDEFKIMETHNAMTYGIT